MSNISLIIEERPRDIGNFLVGRLLPFSSKRMVGPFIFIDHMGPAQLGPGQNIDIAPHPHIGLSTLTYLFEGNVMHKDSLGTEMEVKPGQVNWMTAGSGIVHSERTPAYLRDTSKTLHGLQIWVALPKHLEQMQPEFFHIEENELPTWEFNGVQYKLVAGEIMGRQSPVPVYSQLYFLELKSGSGSRSVKIGNDLYGECGLYILEGSIKTDSETYQPKELLVAKNSQLCEFTMAPDTTIYFFGGEPFPEERFIYWNFVATSRERIEEAKQKWLDQQFGSVPGETDFIPLPVEAKGLKFK
ncbi:pirin family protein [Mucilaginibacter limnophilus]|uniref:Pirin family protein n=1 Tax=Mucilaginibacter limnophilus TaxID=1932778 RepID=A0A3S2VQ31_9SPHI|nr:pirin family protein [Mucilaginibacter limnophilus]RVU02733.1 pirin family protein [Mucilaginibacter limnophilus]